MSWLYKIKAPWQHPYLERDQEMGQAFVWQVFGTMHSLPTHLDGTRSTWGSVKMSWHTERQLGHFNTMRRPNVLSWFDLVFYQNVPTGRFTQWHRLKFAFCALSTDLRNQRGLILLPSLLKILSQILVKQCENTELFHVLVDREKVTQQ